LHHSPLLDIDECVNHTCQNGGSCVDGVNNYSCNCMPGFTGDRCQTGNTFPFLIYIIDSYIKQTQLQKSAKFVEEGGTTFIIVNNYYFWFLSLHLCLFDNVWT